MKLVMPEGPAVRRKPGRGCLFCLLPVPPAGKPCARARARTPAVGLPEEGASPARAGGARGPPAVPPDRPR